MTDTLTPITTDQTVTRPQIQRDGYQRPLVLKVDGSARTAYTRCTKYVDCIEDKRGLELWAERQVGIGLSLRRDLVLAIAADRDDKSRVQRHTDAAKEAAGSSAKSIIGTAVHRLCERMDSGDDVGVVPAEYLSDLAAYQSATDELQALAVEQFLVHDELRIGGTPDRIVRYQGRNYIADIKTGDLKYSTLKFAMQLAIYSRSTTYDVSNDQRGGPVDVDHDRAIIIHLPAGEGICTLHWIDIATGWQAVQIAKQVRDWRRKRDLLTQIRPRPTAIVPGQSTTPLPPMPGHTVTTAQLIDGHALPDPSPAPSASPAEPAPLPPPLDNSDPLTNEIASAPTEQAVRDLWSSNMTRWKEEHTQAAKARIKLITQQTGSQQ